MLQTIMKKESTTLPALINRYDSRSKTTDQYLSQRLGDTHGIMTKDTQKLLHFLPEAEREKKKEHLSFC